MGTLMEFEGNSQELNKEDRENFLFFQTQAEDEAALEALEEDDGFDFLSSRDWAHTGSV